MIKKLMLCFAIVALLPVCATSCGLHRASRPEMFDQASANRMSGYYPDHAHPGGGGELAMIVAGGSDLYALRVADGEVIWAFDCQFPIVTSPVVTNGTVIVGASNFDGAFSEEVIYCINKSNGELKWSAERSETVVRSLTFSDHCVIGIDDWFYPTLFALDLETGQEMWRLCLTNFSYHSAPCVREDRGIVVAGCDAVGFDCRDGREFWRTPIDDYAIGDPIIWGDTAYFCTMDRHILAVAMGNGKVLWRKKFAIRATER